MQMESDVYKINHVRARLFKDDLLNIYPSVYHLLTKGVCANSDDVIDKRKEVDLILSQLLTSEHDCVLLFDAFCYLDDRTCSQFADERGIDSITIDLHSCNKRLRLLRVQEATLISAIEDINNDQPTH